MTLSARQERFVEEVTSDLGPSSEAAKRAGYANSSAKVVACRVLQHPKIQEAIERKKARLAECFDMDRDILAEMYLSVINNPNTPVKPQIKAVRELGLLMGLYRS
jgi:phage terminase small subunit